MIEINWRDRALDAEARLVAFESRIIELERTLKESEDLAAGPIRTEFEDQPLEPSPQHTFYAVWSTLDQEWAGKCDQFPSMSHLASSREEALNGIRDLVADVSEDFDVRRSDDVRPDPFESLEELPPMFVEPSVLSGQYEAARAEHVDVAPGPTLEQVLTLLNSAGCTLQIAESPESVQARKDQSDGVAHGQTDKGQLALLLKARDFEIEVSDDQIVIPSNSVSGDATSMCFSFHPDGHLEELSCVINRSQRDSLVYGVFKRGKKHSRLVVLCRTRDIAERVRGKNARYFIQVLVVGE